MVEVLYAEAYGLRDQTTIDVSKVANICNDVLKSNCCRTLITLFTNDLADKVKP